MARTEAIVLSMTKEERRNPNILNGSRRLRIAKRKWNNSPRIKQIYEVIWNDSKNDEKNEYES